MRRTLPCAALSLLAIYLLTGFYIRTELKQDPPAPLPHLRVPTEWTRCAGGRALIGTPSGLRPAKSVELAY